MDMPHRTHNIIDIILTFVLGATATLSKLDHIEQWCRIFLLFISMATGVTMLLINRKRLIKSVKELFEKCPDE
jgi:hypothetical protein